MCNAILSSIDQFDFYNSSLYGRPLRTHLKQSYLLCKKLDCSKVECIVALYHSFYGELYGYDSNGHSYDDRATLKTLLGADVEEIVYLYNVIQAKQGLYLPYSEEARSDKFWYDSLVGKIAVSGYQREVLVNVSVVETLEQVNYLADVSKQYSIEDLVPHIKKLEQYLWLCHPKVQHALSSASERISYVTSNA